ncbi:MAG: HAMP domain-containing sensor histidine kinase [Actinoplanes sp.]
MRRRVPLHRSLVGRLLATSVLMAMAAIAATAWLAAQSTTRAIRQEQGRSLADDKSIYDVLIGYAATHRDWTGAQPIVQAKAAEAGRRVTLMDEDRAIIADSGPGASLDTVRASATVDALRLDQGLVDSADRIDARAVGPYRLPKAERDQLRRLATRHLDCLGAGRVGGQVVDDASGRPTVRITTADPYFIGGLCAAKNRNTTATEDRALTALATMTERCLGLTARGSVSLARDFSVLALRRAPVDRARDVSSARVRSCVRESRVTQLRPYVAPPALLFVTDPGNPADAPVFSLSRANVLRIVWVTGAVLLVTIGLTVLTGRRLVRPLRALTEAAMEPLGRSAPVPVTGDDEIGYLARALNDLTERRERAETQRRLMVSDVAHELRNPLTNIRAWLEAAQDDVMPADPALLELLHDEATMLHHIIDDLGDLAAADAGRLSLHPEMVYVRDLLTQAFESHRGAAEKAGLTFTADLRGDPVMSADPVRLRQLAGNLLANAIRYTPPGGTVTLTAGVDAGELTVAVHDTGVGIAPDDLPKIFDRFWRADTSRTRATGGSGLGLPIARNLAEAHGGTLIAASRPDAGTTFTLRLPLNR